MAINSINPQLWGKSGWNFLFSVALTYKPEFKYFYKNLFVSLGVCLPCTTCAINYREHLPELDAALDNKMALLNWLQKIRNSTYIRNGVNINKTLKNSIGDIFYENNTNYYNYITIIISIIILIILIIISYYITKNKNLFKKE